MMRAKILDKAAELSDALLKAKVMVATAESCTGGMVAEVLTSFPGSSAWFERAFIAYSYESKYEMLGVHAKTVQEYGSVSKQCVEDMAVGALQNAHVQLTVAISGIAGPDGASHGKPVGTVWIAWAGQHMSVVSKGFHFEGDRHSVREQATLAALEGMLDRLHHIE
jgi:nicotinamide-nucleotide amidase